MEAHYYLSYVPYNKSYSKRLPLSSSKDSTSQTSTQHFSTLDGRPHCLVCLRLHEARPDTPFCSEGCAASYAAAHTQGSARRQLFEREGGVCQVGHPAHPFPSPLHSRPLAPLPCSSRHWRIEWCVRRAVAMRMPSSSAWRHCSHHRIACRRRAPRWRSLHPTRALNTQARPCISCHRVLLSPSPTVPRHLPPSPALPAPARLLTQI